MPVLWPVKFAGSSGVGDAVRLLLVTVLTEERFRAPSSACLHLHSARQKAYMHS